MQANWGDQGNGRYKNPILKADYSDPDVIRVNEDFYLIASDFHFMGMQILHSKDLVNWEVLSQVFSSLTIDPKYDIMEAYGQGTWAPAIRYHKGRFYIYVCTPREGLMMWYSENPAGPWSDVVVVKQVKGWEDPCPFWDDDDQAYLVRGVVGAGHLIVHQMCPDGAALLDEGQDIYQHFEAEGPKFYKRNGYYYISFPENGVESGCQSVIRSKNIYGPYEHKLVFPDGSPHQGGLVELASGEWWFIGFKSAGHLGRICHLEPVCWVDDWPVFGDNGQHVHEWKKPNIGHATPASKPQLSDKFDKPTLNPIWQWNHNPENTKWSLTERPGCIRLKCIRSKSLKLARNTLTQKIWDDFGSIRIKINIIKMQDGQFLGLAFMSGDHFDWIGVEQRNNIKRVVSSVGDYFWQKRHGPVVVNNEIYFRAKYTGNIGSLSYSFDDKIYTQLVPLLQKIRFRFGCWKGARVAIFYYGNGEGYVDLEACHYESSSSPIF